MDTGEGTALHVDGEFLAGIASEQERPCREIAVSSGATRVINDFGSRTVARLIRRLIGATRPPRGAISVLGIDVGGLSHRRALALRRRLGVAGGESALIGGLTVAENLSLPCQLKKLSSRQITTRVRRISEALELDDLLSVPASTLGIVERRIALLARAIAHDPELIVLEAPLAGLTERWRSAALEQFKRLSVTGSTVIVFHESSEALMERATND